MYKEIKILDCTLRDGGRCFGNTWGDSTIKEISYGLSDAGIDFIELGFLWWYTTDAVCRVNSTMFQEPGEMNEFSINGHKYLTYIAYALFKMGNYEIPLKEETCLDGIRLGLFKDESEDAKNTMQEIIQKGYKLFVQGINALSYSKDEWIHFIKIVNDIKPYAFSIVDTYGNIDEKTLIEIASFINIHLDKSIALNFHSHNSKGLSNHLARKFIELTGTRTVILDTTLNGIGMGAGNLSTEFMIEELIKRNPESDSQYNKILIDKLIEKHIAPLKRRMTWEHSEATALAAENWMPNIYLSYILNRYYQLNDINKKLLVGMYPIAKSGGTHLIDTYYRVLMKEEKVGSTYEILKNAFYGKDIVVVGKGPSLIENCEELKNTLNLNKKSSILVFVNAYKEDLFKDIEVPKYYYFSNVNYFEEFNHNREKNKSYNEIILSGIGINPINGDGVSNFPVNFIDLVGDMRITSADSLWVILNLIKFLDLECRVYLAGFDGTDSGTNEHQVFIYKKYLKIIEENLNICFLTPSVYQESEE